MVRLIGLAQAASLVGKTGFNSRDGAIDRLSDIREDIRKK